MRIVLSTAQPATLIALAASLALGSSFPPSTCWAGAEEEPPICISGADEEVTLKQGQCPGFDSGSTQLVSPAKARRTPARAGDTQVKTYLVGNEVPGLVKRIAQTPDEREALRQFEVLVAMGDTVVDPLIGVFSDSDLDSNVRWVAARALGRIQNPAATAPLIAGLTNTVPMVRVAAARSLQDLGDPRARGPLVAALKDKGAVVRSAVLDALGAVGSIAEAPAVAAELEAAHNFVRGQSLFVRTHAANALGRLGGPGSIEALIGVVEDKDPEVRAAAQRSLLALTGRSTTPAGAGGEQARWKSWWASQH